MDCSRSKAEIHRDLFLFEVPLNPKPGYLRIVFVDDRLDSFDLAFDILGNNHHLLIPILADLFLPSLQTDQGAQCDGRYDDAKEIISCADTKPDCTNHPHAGSRRESPD